MPDARYGTLDGFALAAGEAHRRRTANVRVGAAALAVVAVLGGSTVAGRPTATDRLEPTESTPSVTASPDLSVAPSPRARSTAGHVAPPASPAAGPTAVPVAPARPVSGVATAAPTTVAPSASAAPRRVWSTPITRRETGNDATVPCVTADGSPCRSPEWPVGKGDRVVFASNVCAPTGTTVELTFADDAEMEYWVTPQFQPAKVLWRSLSDRPARPSPHSETLESERCLEWTTTWLRRGDDGVRVPPGQYTVWMSVRSPEAPGGAISSDFSLD